MVEGNQPKYKTKVSVSIIGDAYADLFCYLGDTLPELGGDVRVDSPMNPVAGGSALNSATHLSALIKDYSTEFETGQEELIDVTLQTAINECDDYGRVLLNHAKNHDFQLLNCQKHKQSDQQNTKKADSSQDEKDTIAAANNKDDDNNNNNDNHEEPKEPNTQKTASTGHCIVIVAEQERTFISHLGVIATFKASDTILHELVNCRSADPSFKNHHHHIHIAGYYNMPGFSNGNLKRRLKLVREKRRGQSHGLNAYTTTTSLVPQYDATGQWNGGLLDDVLPLVDFFILNALEAGKITNIPIDDKNCGTALNRTVLFAKLADFFWEKSPQTYVIVTLGSKGAVALYEGEAIASINSPVQFHTPIDPTGAGDAFAAGFLFGVMSWRKKQSHEKCAEIGSYLEGSWTEAIAEGMRYGCAAGTACVMQPGASVPASKDILDKFLSIGQDSGGEEDGDGNGHGDDDTENEIHLHLDDYEDEEDDSEYDPEQDEEDSFEGDEFENTDSDYDSDETGDTGR